MRSRKNKTIKAYEKVLKKDNDWDFSYLYQLERLKLKRMFNYFSEVGKYCNPEISGQISMCIKLLDIILEEDPITLKYLNEYKIKPLYPKYVNWKNEGRFNLGKQTNIKLELSLGTSFKDIKIQFLLENLRRKKAINLYHKLRIRFTDSWWE